VASKKDGEVLLEAVASAGPAPFTEPVAPVQPPITVPPATPGRSPAGPFGGTGDNTLCDRELLVQFLTDPAHVTQAQEWARIVGISVSDIPTYVRDLVPTVLSSDTRVTNHTFEAGRARGYQAVLQAGTAVLVDTKGKLVARCRCGNPLLAPVKVTRPVYTGTRWPGFDPTTILVIVISPTDIYPPGGVGTLPPTTPTTEPEPTATTETSSGGDKDKTTGSGKYDGTYQATIAPGPCTAPGSYSAGGDLKFVVAGTKVTVTVSGSSGSIQFEGRVDGDGAFSGKWSDSVSSFSVSGNIDGAHIEGDSEGYESHFGDTCASTFTGQRVSLPSGTRTPTTEPSKNEKKAIAILRKWGDRCEAVTKPGEQRNFEAVPGESRDLFTVTGTNITRGIVAKFTVNVKTGAIRPVDANAKTTVKECAKLGVPLPTGTAATTKPSSGRDKGTGSGKYDGTYQATRGPRSCNFPDNDSDTSVGVAFPVTVTGTQFVFGAERVGRIDSGGAFSGTWSETVSSDTVSDSVSGNIDGRNIKGHYESLVNNQHSCGWDFAGQRVSPPSGSR
jgi:hypothetical protein